MGQAGFRQGAARLGRPWELELRMKMLFRAFVLPAVALNAVGCAAVPKSPSSSTHEQASNGYVELSAYLSPAERAERTYARTNPSRRDE